MGPPIYDTPHMTVIYAVLFLTLWTLTIQFAYCWKVAVFVLSRS